MIDYEHYENLEPEPEQPHSRPCSQPPRRLVTARRAERVPLSQPEDERAHFQNRAIGRYGHELSGWEIGRIKEEIQSRKAALVEALDGGFSTWNVHVPPHVMRVVYHERSRRIITILPPHLITRNEENRTS